MKPSAIKGAVLVTGASSGIGKACAFKLNKLGYQVFAGVRNRKDRHILEKKKSENFVPIHLDITNDDSIADAMAKVTEEMNAAGLKGLVNNAGIVVSGPLEFVSKTDLKRQLEVNVIGQIAMIQAFLPLLRKYKGRIVNMGSTSGKIASSFMGPYCASKFALEAFTDTLRMELQQSGIQVSIIEPGVIATPMWEKMQAAEDELIKNLTPYGHRLYGHALDRKRRLAIRLKGSGAKPDKVADAVIYALTSKQPKTRYVIGLQARFKITVAKFLPDRLRDRLIVLRRNTSS